MKWEKGTVFDLCYINPENIPRNYPHDYIRYFDITSVGSGVVTANDEIPLNGAPSRAKRIVRSNDTILATVRPGNRSFYYFKTAFENSIASTGFAVLRPKVEIADPRFLYYLVTEPLFTAYLVAYEQGANYPAVNPDIIGSKPIEYPPLPTQRKIASILSAYDDLIEINLKRIKLLEEKAFASYKIINKVEKLKLEELYDTSSGGTPSRANAEYFTGEINWFKSKELADSILLESEEKITEGAVEKSSAKLFPAGSVIMAMYGATIGKLGLLSQPSTTNQACCAIIEKDDIKSNYYILNWFLENREYVLSFRMGAAQENISQQVIKNLLVSIPKDNDLKIFNSEVKPIYQLIKNLHQQNTKLREARDILLPKLMNGQIEV
jgi:type I restriction enzyme S subunit